MQRPEVPFEDLNRKEKEIVRSMNAARRPLNTNQVAERSDMAWQTAKKWLKELGEKGYVDRRKRKNGTYWILR